MRGPSAASTRAGFTGGAVGSLIHTIQVRAHGRNRVSVSMTSHLFHQRNMADTQAEKKAAGIRFRETILRCRRCDGIARVDVRNSRGYDDPLGRAQNQPCVSEGFAAHTLREPDGAETELFKI